MGNAVADPDDRRSSATCSSEVEVRDVVTDVAEFSAFYRDAVPRLVAFLRWQGASFPDARDCVQESMIAAFQQWSSLQHPYAWCRLVASREYVRRVATLRGHLVAAPEGAGIALAADAVLDFVEQRHAVLRVLDRLPSRQRQVMAWTYDGATPSEIADALQLSSDAVRSTLYKARVSLRAYLDQGGEL